MLKEYRRLLNGGTMFSFGFGIPELIIIAIVVVVLFFGGKRVGDWARGLGRFSTEFKRGKLEAELALKELENEVKDEGTAVTKSG